MDLRWKCLGEELATGAAMAVAASMKREAINFMLGELVVGGGESEEVECNGEGWRIRENQKAGVDGESNYLCAIESCLVHVLRTVELKHSRYFSS